KDAGAYYTVKSTPQAVQILGRLPERYSSRSHFSSEAKYLRGLPVCTPTSENGWEGSWSNCQETLVRTKANTYHPTHGVGQSRIIPYYCPRMSSMVVRICRCQDLN